jgi:hypothetical protein
MTSERIVGRQISKGQFAVQANLTRDALDAVPSGMSPSQTHASACRSPRALSQQSGTTISPFVG